LPKLLKNKKKKKKNELSLITKKEEYKMSKKLIFVCLAVLAIAPYALADNPPVLVGSFEGVNDGWHDHVATANNGWVPVYVDDPTINPSLYQFSDAWATNGDYSLETTVTAWGFYMRREIRDVYWEHSKIEFDVYATDNGGGWAQIERIVEQFSDSPHVNGGWTDLPGSHWDLAFGQTTHIVYDYSAYKGGEYGTEAATYGNFIFGLNSSGAGVNIFLDNIQFTGIPEPATISLLGLGGLALLRRKK
jgi:hypothetical protein